MMIAFWIGILGLFASLAQGQSDCSSDIPCEAGGICQDVPFDTSSLPLDPVTGNVIFPDSVPDAQFSCACPEDRTGLYCEHRIQRCADRYVCYHGGECLQRQDGSFICDCTTANDSSGTLTVGPYCEEQVPNISNCADNPGGFCLGRGSCSDAQDNDLNPCNCEDPYTGRNCEFFTQELPSCDLPCGDNGVCRYGVQDVNSINSKLGVQRSDNGQYCECRTGFFGARCDVVQPNTCDDQATICFNGASCKPNDATNSYECDCESTDAKVAGSMCQYVATDLCENPKYPPTAPENPQPNQGFCTNQGTCYQADAGFTFCGCAGGFQGSNCEYVENTPAPNAQGPPSGEYNTPAPAVQYPTFSPKPSIINGTYSPTITWQPSRTPYPTKTPHPSITAFPSTVSEGTAPAYPTSPPPQDIPSTTPYPTPDTNDEKRSESPEANTRDQDDFTTSDNASLEDELKQGAKAGIAVAVVIVTVFGLVALRQRRQTVVRHQNLARANFEAQEAGDNWQSSMALTEDNEKGVELI